MSTDEQSVLTGENSSIVAFEVSAVYVSFGAKQLFLTINPERPDQM